MGELQLYRDIATGVLGVLVLIIGYLYTTMAADVKAKLSREEFAAYLLDAKQSRNEIRDTLVKLFERADNHEKLDASRFDGVTKDFNGGVNRLVEKVNEVQINILTQLNQKADK